LAERIEKQREDYGIRGISRKAVYLKVIIKASKRESLGPNRRGYRYYMNNTIKA
jgi:hypothetical protein